MSDHCKEGCKCKKAENKADTTEKKEMVYSPKHYLLKLPDGHECEVIDVIKATSRPIEYAGAMKFQVEKYVLRADKKMATIQDLKKARYYLDEWIKLYNPNEKSWKDLEKECKALEATIKDVLSQPDIEAN